MQIVKAKADAKVLDAGGQLAYTLRAGVRYALYDQETGYGLRDGALELAGAVDRIVPPYAGGPLETDRLLLPFIGRQGDALVAASCLAALREQYPGVKIDVACTDATHGVWIITSVLDAILPYPLEADRLSAYDYHLSFERVDALTAASPQSCAEAFAVCLGTPRPRGPIPLMIPPEAWARWKLPPTGRPRVAVHAGRPESPKSHPPDLRCELIKRLLEEGFEVYIIGQRVPGESGDSGRLGEPHNLHDLVGRTPSPADLAAVIAQMASVVTGDSFPLHLAGALAVPTVALFTSTAAVIGSDYPAVVTVQSPAACSPCHVADGACPRGHGACIAHREPAVSPEAILRLVYSTVSQAASA